MPFRSIVNRELASLLGVFSHPDRLALIEELRQGEQDVNGLTAALGVSQSRVSQHLSLLRSHRLVVERREGRRVFYRLADPSLAEWLLEGLRFVEGEADRAIELRTAVARSREVWGLPEGEPMPEPEPRKRR